jgi:hypothetical protein
MTTWTVTRTQHTLDNRPDRIKDGTERLGMRLKILQEALEALDKTLINRPRASETGAILAPNPTNDPVMSTMPLPRARMNGSAERSRVVRFTWNSGLLNMSPKLAGDIAHDGAGAQQLILEDREQALAVTQHVRQPRQECALCGVPQALHQRAHTDRLLHERLSWRRQLRHRIRVLAAAGRSRRVNSLGEAPAPRARQSAPGCRRCPSR